GVRSVTALLLAVGGAPGLLACLGGAGQALADVEDVGSSQAPFGAAVPAEDDDAPLGPECGRRPAGQERAGLEPVGGVPAHQLRLGGGQLRRLRREGLRRQRYLGRRLSDSLLGGPLLFGQPTPGRLPGGRQFADRLYGLNDLGSRLLRLAAAPARLPR